MFQLWKGDYIGIKNKGRHVCMYTDMGKCRKQNAWTAELHCYISNLMGISIFKKSRMTYIKILAAVTSSDVRFFSFCLFAFSDVFFFELHVFVAI